MRERYAPLSTSGGVFRLARVGGGFLPPGHRLPKPEWLEPDKQDIAEAAKSGRAPGLSVWDTELATHEDACWWRDVPPEDYRSFAAPISKLLACGARHARSLGVVADPLPTDEPRLKVAPVGVQQRLVRAAEGHSLIEGIARPEGAPKQGHKLFRAELAELFGPT
jgi:hypothetical protein